MQAALIRKTFNFTVPQFEILLPEETKENQDKICNHYITNTNAKYRNKVPSFQLKPL